MRRMIPLAATALFAVLIGTGASLWPTRAAAQETAPTTMKAVRIHAHGAASQLKLEEAPRPVPGEGQLLLRVHAAGINPVDWKVRAGQFPMPGAKFPMILGYDVCGVVDSVGEGVTEFKAGDEVFAYLALKRGGGYAQYAIVEQTEAARKPASLDHVHSAAVPLAALTAWQALFDAAGLREGQTVLIHGGSGGVGHFAVQMAKAKGARVYATASANNLDFLRELGADEAIDYRAQRFEEVLTEGADVVFDMIGGSTLERSYAVVKPGGYLVSIVEQPDGEKLRARGIRGNVILVRPDGAELARIASMIDGGEIEPHVSQTFPLTEAARAHAAIEGGHTRGKIVLEIE